MLCEDRADADGGNDKDCADQNQRLQLARGRQQHGGKAEDRRQHIDDGDGLLLRKAHVDQPVVYMTAVGGHRVLPLCNAAQECEADVKDRQAEDQKRHRERDDGIELKQARDRQRGKDIAEEGRAGVAHEDLGGVHVVGDEAARQ